MEYLGNRFKVMEKINSGEYLDDFLGMDFQSASTKVLMRKVRISSEDTRNCETITKEFDSLKGLNIPGIPRFIDGDAQMATTNEIWLIHEYFESTTLKDSIARGDAFPMEQVFYITEELLKILDSLRSPYPPIIHRSINPENIIFDKSGNVYLSGFGDIKAIMAKNNSFAPKVVDVYVAPEYTDFLTPKSDLYSLGVTLLHMILGIDPASLPRMGKKIQIPKDFSFDKNYIKFIDMMIDPNQNSRFRDTKMAIEVLSKIKTGEIAEGDFSLKRDTNDGHATGYDKYLLEKEVFVKPSVNFGMHRRGMGNYAYRPPKDEYSYTVQDDLSIKKVLIEKKGMHPIEKVSLILGILGFFATVGFMYLR
jgi:serine/threonine protein kinase